MLSTTRIAESRHLRQINTRKAGATGKEEALKQGRRKNPRQRRKTICIGFSVRIIIIAPWCSGLISVSRSGPRGWVGTQTLGFESPVEYGSTYRLRERSIPGLVGRASSTAVWLRYYIHDTVRFVFRLSPSQITPNSSHPTYTIHSILFFPLFPQLFPSQISPRLLSLPFQNTFYF